MENISELFKITYYKKSVDHEAKDTKTFALLENASTKWEHNGKEYRIIIPSGFEWDGATLPQFTWSILGYYPSGVMLTPSLWHDYIYIFEGKIRNVSTLQDEEITREHCDQLFYMHMLRSGVEPKKAKMFYKYVRFFGRFFWFDKSNNWLTNWYKKK
jgi:hypothetical protein